MPRKIKINQVVRFGPLTAAADPIRPRVLNPCLFSSVIQLSSHLKNRTQSVKLNKSLSSKVSVQFRVPKGSVLGTILYHIYVNNMKDNSSDCTLVQYDTHLHHHGHIENISEIIHQTENSLRKIKTI